MTDVYETSRQLAAEQRTQGLIDDQAHTGLLSMIAMCERQRILPIEGLVLDLWGFGHVPAAFTSLDNTDWWVEVGELAEPIGRSIEDLEAAWGREYADLDDTEAVGWKAQVDYFDAFGEGGTAVRLKFCSNTFVMNLMAGMSPWSKEFMANTQDLMRTAFVKSGLADLFDQVPAYVETLDENGETILVPSGRSLADATRENLPDEAAARARAFSGSAGALDQDGGGQ